MWQSKNLRNPTALKMVQLAESFFTSIGLKAFPKSFYNKSLFTKPEDGRAVVCHASAWVGFPHKQGRQVRLVLGLSPGGIPYHSDGVIIVSLRGI